MKCVTLLLLLLPGMQIIELLNRFVLAHQLSTPGMYNSMTTGRPGDGVLTPWWCWRLYWVDKAVSRSTAGTSGQQRKRAFDTDKLLLWIRKWWIWIFNLKQLNYGRMRTWRNKTNHRDRVGGNKRFESWTQRLKSSLVSPTDPSGLLIFERKSRGRRRSDPVYEV